MVQKVIRTIKGNIEYRLEGNGPVIMVLYGGHCSRNTRLPFEQLVNFGFSVLTPSRPGYDLTSIDNGKSAQEAAILLSLLLDELKINKATIIGISAAGMTAIAFAQQFPEKTEKLILESAKITNWDEDIKKKAKQLFGKSEKFTWAIVRFMLNIAPRMTLKYFLSSLSTLNPDVLMKKLTAEEKDFFVKLFKTFQSGKGFIHDIEHHIDEIDKIKAKVLIMYSPSDPTSTIKDV